MRLHEIEQRVQTHRVVVDDVDAERPEAVRRIEAGLAHRAVALVEEGCQLVLPGIVVWSLVVIGYAVRPEILLCQIVVRSALCVELGGYNFRRGTLAQSEVAREAGFGRAVRLACPITVTGFDCGNSIAEPFAIVRSMVDTEQHLGQEWRLRPHQVVGAVGIQNLAVVADLVEGVVGHVLGESVAMIAQQADLNEVAVPAVHLIEPAARNNVRPRQIQEAGNRGSWKDPAATEAIGRRRAPPRSIALKSSLRGIYTGHRPSAIGWNLGSGAASARLRFERVSAVHVFWM